MKTRIIGDVHGKIPGYLKARRGASHSVQIGDMGFRKDYQRIKDLEVRMNSESGTHMFFRGNHDEYGGYEPENDLGDYGTLPWDDSVFFIRGAASIDRDMRTPGKDWFHDEELSFVEARKAVSAWEESDASVLLTHDCADSMTKTLFDASPIQSLTGEFLSTLLEVKPPETWIFGHWHTSKDVTIDGTRFICLAELEAFELET